MDFQWWICPMTDAELKDMVVKALADASKPVSANDAQAIALAVIEKNGDARQQGGFRAWMYDNNEHLVRLANA